ncbi:MAG: serine hydrolase [Prevotellaceae bacterium]|jgi:beta-glucosidase-like glycosyl hydrolase/CubicO group peptidase (beta-lactamase class C family)|nr:serine hydrolase [Prevotellaceae bacterium]
MKKYFLAACCVLILCVTDGRTQPASFSAAAWADSLMNTLTLRQRVAQLFMVAVNPDADDSRFQKSADVVAKEQVGGVIAMRGNPHLWALMINRLQRLSRIPLLAGIDGEHGVGMRLDSVNLFMRQMPLGALSDNTLIYEMGKAVAQQCRRLGIFLNFAPVADVNNNPDNPVIGIRSFGEDIYKVTEKSIAYMRGMQDGGILTCAKHFPGHGDTDKDSHLELPALHHDRARIDSLDLYPFKALMNAGVDAIMTGHLRVMAIDSVLPASLSQAVTGGLLQEELGFGGLVFTDALNMRGVADHYPKPQLGLLALQAGSDILLMPEEVTGAIDVIMQAVANGTLPEQEIDRKCKKMLEAKYRTGLTHYTPVDPANLPADLNTTHNEVLQRRTAEASVTLLVNKNNLLPLAGLDTLHIAYLEVGTGQGAVFGEQLARYAKIARFSVSNPARADTLDSLYRALAPYNLLIVGYHSADVRARFNFGVDTLVTAFLQRVCARMPVVLDFFGVPYALKKFAPLDAYHGIIISYQNVPQQQLRSAQLLFGGITPRARLPVTLNDSFPAGYGLTWPATVRLRDVLPEEMGIAASQLSVIDSIMQEAISRKATPGGQILAACRGQVFYHKAFGRHSYDSAAPPVRLDDLYDLASLTKVTATLPVVMHLVNTGQIQLSGTLGDYLPLDLYKDKQALHLMDVLAHQSGLPAYAPFHRYFIREGRLSDNYFSTAPSGDFPVPVARNLYASSNMIPYIYMHINATKLMKPTYRYSDWGFIYLQQLVEKVAGARLDKLSDSLFFAPLGMYNTHFLPLRTVAPARIAPTEHDREFRKQLLQGYVHDQTAAMLGGVAGHAGLFSTAGDLAKLLQMLLNKGEYGDRQYLDSPIVQIFTGCPFCDTGNRRAPGFDKPEPNPGKASPVGRNASPESFGHSGYTGTFCWVDPRRRLVYVFLSNRVHPADDKKLNSLGTRTRILSEFIDIIDSLPEEL